MPRLYLCFELVFNSNTNDWVPPTLIPLLLQRIWKNGKNFLNILPANLRPSSNAYPPAEQSQLFAKRSSSNKSESYHLWRPHLFPTHTFYSIFCISCRLVEAQTNHASNSWSWTYILILLAISHDSICTHSSNHFSSWNFFFFFNCIVLYVAPLKFEP